MAKYFTQRDLSGSISYSNDGDRRGKISIGSTLVSVPGGTAVRIMDARFNSDGVLVVKTDDGASNGMNLQTHFIFGPRYGDCITEYNHSGSKPNSRLSDYNREVQAARQEREGARGGSSSSSSGASSAAAFGAGAAVGTGLIQGLVNRSEKKKLEKFQTEEAARQEEADREERKRQLKEQEEMEEQIELQQKEMEAYERKALLESMTSEERKAFLLQEREEKKKKAEREKQEEADRRKEWEADRAKERKINLIFYPLVLGLVVILHLWFWLDDDFEWWQASLWGLLTLVVGGVSIYVKVEFL